MNRELSVAIKVARKAGQLLRKRFATTHGYTMKDVHNVVTASDVAVERLIAKELRRAFPNYGMYGEESGLTSGSDRSIWVVDPLDGTTNFSHHFPYYGVSIALVKKGQIVCGVVVNPSQQESFWAQQGQGAFLNGKRLHVHPCEPEKAVISISRGASSTGKRAVTKLMPKLLHTVRTFRFHGAAALELCDVAANRTDGFLGIAMSTYDTAAGLCIAHEAGAIIKCAKGKPWHFSWKPQSLVVGSPKMDSLLSRLLPS